MLDYELFLGYPLDEDYQKKLDVLQTSLKNLFIQNHSDYLKIMEYEGQNYLGKSLGKSMDIQNLELVKENILSILNRLIPLYSYDTDKFVLLPIAKLENHES